jgi:hypothetical protein
MNLADAVVSGGVTLATLVISWAVKALFARDRDKAASHRDHSDAFARERETWRQDYDHAYEQIKEQCDDCTRKLNLTVVAFYGLLDDLEEQILPMLILPRAIPSETSKAVRVCMNNARRRVRDSTPS